MWSPGTLGSPWSHQDRAPRRSLGHSHREYPPPRLHRLRHKSCSSSFLRQQAEPSRYCRTNSRFRPIMFQSRSKRRRGLLEHNQGWALGHSCSRMVSEGCVSIQSRTCSGSARASYHWDRALAPPSHSEFVQGTRPLLQPFMQFSGGGGAL